MKPIVNLPAVSLQPSSAQQLSEVEKSSGTFGKMLTNMVEEVNGAEQTGDKAIEALQSGKAQHLHEVMIAVEEADVSMRMLVQMRNRALSAYEEIMRMQV